MTGEVAGLFPKEELDSIVGDMRPVMKLECPGTHPIVDLRSENFFFGLSRCNLRTPPVHMQAFRLHNAVHKQTPASVSVYEEFFLMCRGD